MRARSFVTALLAATILSAGPAVAETQAQPAEESTGFIASIRKAFEAWNRKVQELAEKEKSGDGQIATRGDTSSEKAEGDEKAN